VGEWVIGPSDDATHGTGCVRSAYLWKGMHVDNRRRLLPIAGRVAS